MTSRFFLLPILLVCATVAAAPKSKAKTKPLSDACRLIVRDTLLLQGYANYCPQPDMLAVAGSMRRLEKAHKRQKELVAACGMKYDEPAKQTESVKSIPGLAPVLEAAVSGNAMGNTAVILEKSVYFCAVHRAEFSRLVNERNTK